MSAKDNLRQIEAAPVEEKHDAKQPQLSEEPGTYQATPRLDAAEAAAISERIFSEHAELFRRLAQ